MTYTVYVPIKEFMEQGSPVHLGRTVYRWDDTEKMYVIAGFYDGMAEGKVRFKNSAMFRNADMCYLQVQANPIYK